MKATAANAALNSAYRIFRFGKSFLYLIQLHFFFMRLIRLSSFQSALNQCGIRVFPKCVCLFVCLLVLLTFSNVRFGFLL